MDAASRTLDDEARNELYGQAEILLLSEVPIAPVYFHTRPFLIHPALKGAQSNPLGLLDFKRMRLLAQ